MKIKRKNMKKDNFNKLAEKEFISEEIEFDSMSGVARVTCNKKSY